MARHVMKTFTFLITVVTSVQAYWLMGIEDFITTERLDPIISPGQVSGHTHSVLGGSNFRMNVNSTAALRASECTSIPIPEDKSNYWFPHLYFWHQNGSFTSLNGGAVIDTSGTTTAFPDDFRMISGDPTLRTYNASSYAQQAVTFLCLDFSGTSTRYNSLPPESCPDGVRAQINFPSCWDGKNVDSPNHQSHVAFPSGGPDSGTCNDPNYSVTIPRIFIEVYWDTASFDSQRSQAMNSTQPFVFAYGDATGYGYHADYMNGWDAGVLQKAVDNCHCNPYGDPTCCVDQGIFHMNQGQTCHLTKAVNEQTTGTVPKLPGNNPVQPEGSRATMYTDPNPPLLINPIYAYTGATPTQTGTPVRPPASGKPTSVAAAASSALTTTRSASSAVVTPSSSSAVVPSTAVVTPSSIGGTSSNQIVSTKSVASTSVQSTFTQASPTFTHSHSMSIKPPAVGPSVTPSASQATAADVANPTASSDDGNDDDCEDDDDNDDDGTNNSSAHASTTRLGASTLASSASASPAVAHSSLVAPPAAVVSPSSSHVSTAAQASPTASDDDDEDDCDEDDGEDETDDGFSSVPSASVVSPSKPNSPTLADDSTSTSTFATATPATTLILTGGSSVTSSASDSQPTASGSQPVCSAEKFRHKRLREELAQKQRRSVHHARSHHDRFVRSHVRAHVY